MSPLEMRELKKDEIPFVVNIFGRTAVSGGHQTKISLLVPDFQVKETFEAAVINAFEEKYD